MSNELAVISDDQWLLVKRTLMDTDRIFYSDDEFKLFVNQAKRTGLDPFTRQIYATKTGGKMTVQATIDGLRLIAQRSGLYEGQTRPIWFDEDGKEYRVWPKSKGNPYACEVGVYKKGFKEPLYAIAIFDEYCAKIKDFKTGEIKIGHMWAKMPALMIAKVAEALALRKAFPNDMSGIYSAEEISVSDNEVKEIEPQKPQKESEPIKTIPNVFDQAATKKESYAPPELVESVSKNCTLVGNTEKTKSEIKEKQPEMFPDKTKILISREQAGFLFVKGYTLGFSKDEIITIIYNLTKKIKIGELNNSELELIIKFLNDNKK